jgi:mannose-6-phosphate isomerase
VKGARVLPGRMVEKPWGRDRLPLPFRTPSGKRIGEIWFEPPPELDDLLIKYLFTGEKLSVQVHPSDGQAPAGARGKDECWLILDAEPGARLAVGFEQAIGSEAMREAALDGSIEELLAWHAVSPGDFFYLPAGTVHAIGAGITLVETQQNSDVTYRLYDYGRPRELHLDEAIAVARGGPHPADCRRRVSEGSLSLVTGPHFRLDRLCGAPDAETARRYAGGPLLVLPLADGAQIAGAPLERGECGVVSDIAELALPAGSGALIAQPLDR